MRTIKYTAQFKRDYKREKRGQHRVYLDDKLLTVVRLLTRGSLQEGTDFLGIGV